MELERPVTRWRRDNTRSRAGEDSDRPKSRRGTSTYMDTNLDRARTPSRGFPMYYEEAAMGKGMSDKFTTNLHAQRDRLISQQGLNVARTGTAFKQGTRLVQDKRYFLGALQLKVGGLTEELSNIHKNLEQNAKEQATFSIYDKRVKQMASELTEMQALLADHNMAIDKVNTGTDVNRIILETKELANRNESEVAALELLFSDRVRRQEANREIEEHIVKEKYRAEQLAAEMNSALKEKFMRLKKQNIEQSQNVAKRQVELDSLLKSKAHLGDQVYISPGRTDAVQSEIKLWELEKRLETLKRELQVSSSPEEQRSSLLNRLKNDNLQITTLKKTINEMQEQIKHAEQALSHTHQVTDEEQGMRQAKYMELKNRDETIEEFLSTVESQKENEINKLRALEAEILQLLRKLATKIAVVPTSADYKNINQNHLVKSEILNTLKSIGNEHQNLSRHLNKVEVMSNKIENELKTLTSSIDTMRRQSALFSNTAELETNIEKKRTMLTAMKAELDATRGDIKSRLRDVTTEFNEAQRALVENEEHAKISYIEKKLSSVDQSNAVIKEYLDDAKSGEDIEICRSKALSSVSKLNILIRNCVK